MTHKLPSHMTRRTVLGLAALGGMGALSATKLHAEAEEEPNPADLVPRRISVTRFNSLNRNELYKFDVAIRQGRTVQIGNHTPSESRRMISEAYKTRQ